MDIPDHPHTLSGTARVSGWIFTSDTAVRSVVAYLDDISLGSLRHDVKRPDVAEAYDYPLAAVIGYEGRFVLDAVPLGPHRLAVEVADALGRRRRFDAAVEVVASPIAGALDEPEDDQTIAEELPLSGWARSSAAPILGVEAFIDGIAVGTIDYGIERSDVLRALGLPDEDERCGFADRLHLDARLSGPRRLAVLVTDARGNMRTFARAVYVTQRSGHIFLDEPTPGEGSTGILVVRGWAFSRKAPIYNVQVFLGDRLLGAVPHGLVRTDVRDLFDHPYAKNSGFHGILRFPVEETGPQVVAVRATDLRGEVIEITVPVRIITVDEPLAKIERVVWRGGTVDVEGWAIWPHSAFPRVARLFLDGTPLGEARIRLSRPDVAMRFPNNPDAARSGFRFSRTIAGPVADARRPAELVVEFTDGAGQVLHARSHVAPDPDLPTVPPDVAETIATLIDGERQRTDRDPAILDWHTDFPLGPLFPALTIFSPPLEGDEPTLPYLDGSIDIVVVAGDDPERVAEAKRVAASVVIGVFGASSPRDASIAGAESTLNVECLWRRETPDEDAPDMASPTVSIVIPVHNHLVYTQSCLARVQATTPTDGSVEIIVVDDASTDDTIVSLHRRAASDRRIRIVRNDENLGFVRSCNRGADAATGEFIVFLNNDTLPEPGWLTPLLHIFRDYPDAGAVGGKLVYPDGALQEAGGVIFADGSGYNFGRGDEEAEAPLYSYVREVDYCSGALLATRRILFRELGGFDLRYDPAYYEDVDYAFALRAGGYRVYYQPESVAVHFEGRSSGTDLGAGVKRHQVTNQVAFVEKWRHVLGHQPALVESFDLATRSALAVRCGGTEVAAHGR